MTDDKDNELDPEFESRVRRALGSAPDLPPEVAERLAAMRRKAVAEFDRRAQGRFQFGWGPASAMAAAVATVALAAGLFLFSGEGSIAEMPGADEPEFAAAQDLEVLVELEFLAWLEEEASGAG